MPKLYECACGRLSPEPLCCRDCRELGYQRSRRQAAADPVQFAIDDGGSIPMKGSRTAATGITKRF
ncbi:MAG TPA: hypothetical protein VGH74_15570 [Planctomycetaceae bacterium]